MSAPGSVRTAEPSVPAVAGEPAALGRSAPMTLTAPSIGLRTSHMVELGLSHDRRLEAPKEWEDVGWYSGGAAPGQKGPAVLAGHLDSPTGPAVFHQLGKLRDQDTVSIERADGAVVDFTVYAVERHAKHDFPTEEVYGDTERPELRLITCGGGFDASTGHYTDNIVVFAALVEAPGTSEAPEVTTAVPDPG
ncbi:class F sortase [Nocardiopsis sp. N85]|uniref:class F sortase n=1 Tax=Nocardiopsis sp. N85 TaxID=3029400 RepID=UPI00237F219B|nr:class F sortase [Nocardiopsis sp. N85]MDE3720832.1 class F sortase [Nocardiopsis sp. N85]